MLLRERDGQRCIVTQPVHAWISSQLARAWGNEHFGTFAPREEVILGTELHDIGWLNWESEPTLNHETGLPHTFMQLPTHMHVAIWGSASSLARPFGRYASLLVSMHGTGLYAFHDYERDTEDEARAARAFVQRELDYQQAVIADLERDPLTAADVTPAALARNRRLVSVWDAMSLAICGGISKGRTIANVPAANGPLDIVMSDTGDGVSVDPWPFASAAVNLRFEARVLDGTYSDETELRRAIESAPWTMLAVTLHKR